MGVSANLNIGDSFQEVTKEGKTITKIVTDKKVQDGLILIYSQEVVNNG